MTHAQLQGCKQTSKHKQVKISDNFIQTKQIKILVFLTNQAKPSIKLKFFINSSQTRNFSCLYQTNKNFDDCLQPCF
jgi:hypothetical protein